MTITADQRPYRPYGAALDLWESRDPIVLISGPAGTGKTVGALNKLYYCCKKYPGMRGAILRQTRKSLTESALVTWEEKVCPAGDPILNGAKRSHRGSYVFPNRSTVAVLGYDNPTRLFSSEYDLIFIQEGLETFEMDVEQLQRALRWNVMPYQQIMIDTNPGAPQHWLKQWADKGRCRYLESVHEDNPFLWDRRNKKWTDAGQKYLARLDSLTGVRKQRLRYGRWVQAEGQVYEGWNDAIHLIQPFMIPRDWPRYLSIDFGYTNPFVCQWWAEDHDGRLYMYREIYMTKRLVEDHAKTMRMHMLHDPEPSLIICDHDAEDRATLQRHLGKGTVAAIKEVSPGIQSVASRLKVAGDGKPRLMIFRDALVQRDPELAEAKKPTCTAEEIEGYVWDEKADAKKETPVKEDDHGADCMRYLAHWKSVRPAMKATGNKVESLAGKAAKDLR